jgi:hypothetical protein
VSRRLQIIRDYCFSEADEVTQVSKIRVKKIRAHNTYLIALKKEPDMRRVQYLADVRNLHACFVVFAPERLGSLGAKSPSWFLSCCRLKVFGRYLEKCLLCNHNALNK